MKGTILYFYPNMTAFIRRDIEILSRNYEVKHFNLSARSKVFLPFKMIHQLFFILFNFRKKEAFVCHFAGYSSFFPSLFGRLLGIKCLIIVAGTDGAKFPTFNYGSFTKRLYGFFTAKSLVLATKILPVHESLVWQKYDYFEGGAPAQGYTVFVPNAKKTPFTPVYYGYDSNTFAVPKGISKISNTFLTVGNLASSKVFIRKGNDLIIELAKKRPELSFTLVGWDGKMEFNFPSNVTLKPYMDQKELIKELASHEFYFQLSIMEGFPNALAEAMLCECIPIGSNVSGIPFIIGDTGFILKNRDINQLNSLVNEALNDPRRKNLPLEARRRVSEKFTYEIRQNNLEAEIEQKL